MATRGASTKFASKDRTTSRTFRSGARICGTVRPSPTDSVLETTNTTTETFAPAINRSVNGMATAACLLRCPRSIRAGFAAAPSARKRRARIPGRKKYAPPVTVVNAGSPCDLLPDRPLGDGHVVRPVVRADDGIAFVTQLVEPGIVDPHVLRELELPDQAGAADKGRDAAFDAVFGRPFGQRRPVGPTAADDAAAIHVHRRVARIHPPDVGAKRHGIPVRVHLPVVEVVVPLRVRRKLRIILLWREHERRSTAPPAHQLRRDQFLLLGCVAVGPQKIAERADVLVHAPIGEKTAVPRQDLWLRQRTGIPVLVRIPEEELAWLERALPNRASARYPCPRSPAATCDRGSRSGRARSRAEAWPRDRASIALRRRETVAAYCWCSRTQRSRSATSLAKRITIA